MTRLVLVLLVTCQACQTPAAATSHDTAFDVRPRPQAKNAILITIEALRTDVLGSYGGRASTPVLDSLAGRGWVFENCYSVTMLTNPSHASIMTSLYPRDHGVYDNDSGIQEGARTLATALSRRGLRTGAVIGFPHLNPKVSNLGQGFDRVIPATAIERRASETTTEALHLVDSYVPGERFFLWLHYVDPHAPYEPEVPHRGDTGLAHTSDPMALAVRAAPDFQRHSPYFKQLFHDQKTIGPAINAYLGEVEAVDTALGELVQGLESRGRLHDTALVVTADHGENLGEHRMYFHHGGLYGETVHVPLYVSLTGISPRRVAGLVESVDVAPTVLALVNAPRWEPMRGRSLVELALGESPGRSVAMSEHMNGQMVSARSMAATLIWHRKSSAQFPTYPLVAGKREFYDRVNDAGENRPRELVGPEAEKLTDAVLQYVGAGLRLAARPALERDLHSLRALGYSE